MLKKTIKPITTLPTLRSAKRERLFWIAVTTLILATFLTLVFLSAKQGNPMPALTKTLWICILLLPFLYFSIRSFFEIKQILEFENNYLLQHATITGCHKEDSVLGDQASAMVYWVYFETNEKFMFRQRVGLSTYNQLKPGDQIIVKISIDNPRLCRAEIE